MLRPEGRHDFVRDGVDGSAEVALEVFAAEARVVRPEVVLAELVA